MRRTPAPDRTTLHAELGAKRVRAYLSGDLVADTRAPWLVWERPYYPTYYLSIGDLRAELINTGELRRDDRLGAGQVFDVKTSGGTAAGAAVRFPDSPVAELRDLVRLEWAAMDEWLEEDEPVYTHPRDPYSRVDILTSSRHVRVDVDGHTVAESTRPDDPVRDRPSASVLPAPFRRPARSAAPVGDDHVLPVQGHRDVLVDHRQRCHARERGLDLPHPAAGVREDRRAGVLLHREARRVRRRRAAKRPTTHPAGPS